MRRGMVTMMRTMIIARELTDDALTFDQEVIQSGDCLP
jgi:hypothetical protein